MIWLLLRMGGCVIELFDSESDLVSTFQDNPYYNKNPTKERTGALLETSDETADNAGRKYTYPKVVHAYNVDVQTKLILLGIMMMLSALVFTTTTKMVQGLLKINMLPEGDGGADKV